MCSQFTFFLNSASECSIKLNTSENTVTTISADKTTHEVAQTYIEPAQVGLLFAGEDLECGRLADAVRSDQSQHFSRARGRQSETNIGDISIVYRYMSKLQSHRAFQAVIIICIQICVHVQDSEEK